MIRIISSISDKVQTFVLGLWVRRLMTLEAKISYFLFIFHIMVAYNVGEYRRRAVHGQSPCDFFRNDNKEAQAIRQ